VPDEGRPAEVVKGTRLDCEGRGGRGVEGAKVVRRKNRCLRRQSLYRSREEGEDEV